MRTDRSQGRNALYLAPEHERPFAMTTLAKVHPDDDGARPTAERAGWFGPPGEQIFGLLQEPHGPARGGIVLCPPMFADAEAAYPTFRLLGRRLAEMGFASLRIDYRGTGDSDGDAASVKDVSYWTEDICRACKVFRTAGIEWVGAIGMRLGATLLSAVCPTVADLSAAVLWDPSSSGARSVREQHLLYRLRVDEQKPTGGESTVGGLLPLALTDAAMTSLRRLHLLPPSSPLRTLLVTRNGHLPEGWLPSPPVEVLTADGQDSLLETWLARSAIPMATLESVLNWVCASGPPTSSYSSCVNLMPRLDTTHWTETTVRRSVANDVSLFAVRCEPTTPRDPSRAGCLMFNAGHLPHHGPSRWYVELARRLGEEGIWSERIDLRGLGDSDSALQASRNDPYALGILDDLTALLADRPGPVVTLGLCAGGYHAVEAAMGGRVQTVIAVHLAMDSWALRHRPDTQDPRRRAWVPDRGWLRAVRKARAGESLVWRLPGWAWRGLAICGLQPQPWSAVAALAARGIQLVILSEDETALRPRERVGLRQLTGRAQILDSNADHELIDPNLRGALTDTVVRILSELTYN